jgi:hypothetical protein
MLDHLPRGGLAERLVPKHGLLLDIAIKRLAEQVFFVSECGIKAGRVDPHCLG